MLSARILNTACLDLRCNIDTVPDLTDLWRNQISSFQVSIEVRWRPNSPRLLRIRCRPCPVRTGCIYPGMVYGIRLKHSKCRMPAIYRNGSNRCRSSSVASGSRRPAAFLYARPFHDFAEVFKAVNDTEPYVLLRRDYQYDVRNITRTEASADRELNVLQETPPSPFRLEPFYRNYRLSAIRLTAATSYANGNLTDHQALRRNGMEDRGHRVAKTLSDLYTRWGILFE